MKVVLDTNIIISAFITKNGNPSKILQRVLEQKIGIYYNHTIIAEYIGVATRDKFIKYINKSKIELLMNAIKNIGTIFTPKMSNIIFVDETDRIFYDTAKQSNSFLITGNIKHYPKKDFVLTPAEFLERDY